MKNTKTEFLFGILYILIYNIYIDCVRFTHEQKLLNQILIMMNDNNCYNDRLQLLLVFKYINVIS